MRKLQHVGFASATTKGVLLWLYSTNLWPTKSRNSVGQWVVLYIYIRFASHIASSLCFSSVRAGDFMDGYDSVFLGGT